MRRRYKKTAPDFEPDFFFTRFHAAVDFTGKMEIILISGFVYLFIYFRIFCVLARFRVYEFR